LEKPAISAIGSEIAIQGSDKALYKAYTRH